MQTAVKGTDFSIGRAGPPDETGIVSKGSGINTHLNIIELGVEQHKRVRSVEKKDRDNIKSRTDVTNVTNVNYRCILFEEVSVDLKLLLEHDFPPIFNDHSVRFQVFGRTENLPVFLNSGHPTQLKL